MIVKLLNEIILKEDKKKREETLGKGITSWRSSGLGTCMRGRYLDRLLSGTGIKPEHDPRTLRVFEMGNQVEDWLMNSLDKQDKYKVHQQVELADPEYNLTGHLDGYLIENGSTKPDETIIECKSKNSKAFWYMDKKGEGAAIHQKMQLHTYLYMMNKYGGTLPDGTVIPPRSGLLTKGSLLYVSKDDMAMLEYPVFLNDKELEKMWKYELDTLNKCWKDKTAPPAPEKGSWQEKYCKFCEAGVCGTLDDAMVKGLWEDKEKELEIAPTLKVDGVFNVGDRVIATGMTKTQWIEGRVGTVVVNKIKGTGVIFDDSFGKGHNLDGETTNQDGWWCLGYQLGHYTPIIVSGGSGSSGMPKFTLGQTVTVKMGTNKSATGKRLEGQTGVITKAENKASLTGISEYFYTLDLPEPQYGIWESELELTTISTPASVAPVVKKKRAPVLKVGDKIRMKAGSPYSVTKAGWEGKVVEIISKTSVGISDSTSTMAWSVLKVHVEKI